MEDDGAPLPLTVWLPVGDDGSPAPVRAVIVALHGFDDRKAAFALPASVWRHRGIVTVAYDQRGFGANGNAGYWPGSRTLAQDLAGAVEAARRRWPHVPVMALGESMGGAVVLDDLAGATGAARARPDGVILVAPAVWGRATESVPERVALWFASRVMPAARFTGEGFGVQASDNIPMLRELGRDPLFIKETRIDMVYGLVDLMDEAVAAAPHFRTPALVLYGAHDELIPHDAMDRLVTVLPERDSGRQRLAWYAQGWHMLLRDLDYQIVATDVADWVFDRRAGLASGADLAAASAFGRPEGGLVTESGSPHG